MAGDKLGFVIVDVPLLVLLDNVLFDWFCEDGDDEDIVEFDDDIGVVVVVASTNELWWFSVWRLKDRASQYDLPHPSALHSYGFLFLCVNMCPLLEMCVDFINWKSDLFEFDETWWTNETKNYLNF